MCSSGNGMGAGADRIDAAGYAILVGVRQQPEAIARGNHVAVLDHVAELPTGVHVQQRKRNGRRMKGLLRQTQHHRRVLTNGVKHHWLLELGGHLTHDVDAFGFQQPQVAKLGHRKEV